MALTRTIAQTKKDVDEMSKEDRLYDRLSYQYGKKADRISSEYDKARSKQDRALTGRGMQRSSAGMSTLQGYDNEKIKALSDNESELIAAYENGLGVLDQQQAEEDRFNKQLEENRRQFDVNQAFRESESAREQKNRDEEFGYQKEKDALAQKNYEKEFGYKQEQDALAQKNYENEFAYKKSQDELAQQNRNEEFSYQKEKDALAQQNYENEFAYKKTQDELAQENFLKQFGLQEKQFEHDVSQDTLAQQNWEKTFGHQVEQDTLAQENFMKEFGLKEQEVNQAQKNWETEFAYKKEQDALDRAFAEKQFETSSAQWDKEFEYNKMSDEQKLNYDYVKLALANGGDVSDELLAKAGLSREDYNAMKADVSSGSSSTPTTTPKPTTPPADSDVEEDPNDYSRVIREAHVGGAPENEGENIWSGLKESLQEKFNNAVQESKPTNKLLESKTKKYEDELEEESRKKLMEEFFNGKSRK